MHSPLPPLILPLSSHPPALGVPWPPLLTLLLCTDSDTVFSLVFFCIFKKNKQSIFWHSFNSRSSPFKQMSSQQCTLDLLSKPRHLGAEREHSIQSAFAHCCQDFRPWSLLEPHSPARVRQSPPPYRGEAELYREFGQHPQGNSESRCNPCFLREELSWWFCLRRILAFCPCFKLVLHWDEMVQLCFLGSISPLSLYYLLLLWACPIPCSRIVSLYPVSIR